MVPPPHPPGASNTPDWAAFALAYLAEQLREDAPQSLGAPTYFPRSPLEGEGATLVFPFNANRGGRGLEAYYVVVGRTESNYYSAYGLSAEEAFHLHLGTRFMLEMSIGQASNLKPQVSSLKPSETYNAYNDARSIVDRVAPDSKLENVSVAATFDVEGQLHAVLSCTLNEERIYVIGRDAPPGIYRKVDLPPQVIYRLHLGNALSAEPNPDSPQRSATV